MSQIMLPPPDQPQPPAQYPAYYGPPAYGSPVLTAAPPAYQPEPPKKQALFWRIVKWPIRQVLKAIYLTGRLVSSHKVVSAILLVLIVGLIGSGVFVYQRLNVSPATSTKGQTATGATANTPFTIVNAAAPPLPDSVITWLHAYKTYDGKEEWSTLSPSFQASTTQAAMQSSLDQLRNEGLAFSQFIYTGGYIEPTGHANYTVELVYSVGNQYGIQAFYFIVDSNTGLILNFAPLAVPSASATSSGG